MTHTKVLESNTMQVIFDNGGGLTLQTNEWAHSYEARSYEAIADQAAGDVLTLIADGTTDGWEGDNPDDGYLVLDLDDIRAMLAGTYGDVYGHTAILFHAALLRRANMVE
jgi:hypothetical protein